VAGLDERRAGTGYLVRPEGDAGPGVLVLHSWWGLNDDVRSICDRLADEGFVALAPDLFGGRVVDDPDDAERLLGDADPNELAHLTRSSLHTLRSVTTVPGAAVGVLGLSMGASLALWLATRVPEGVAAASVFYGVQDIDLATATAAFQGHFAEHDRYVERDQLVLMEAELHLLERDVDFHRYPGTSHWFFEPSRPEYDEAAADLAWDRTLAFFADRVAGSGPNDP
jgi:carboxymethylenebutenolidase